MRKCSVMLALLPLAACAVKSSEDLATDAAVEADAAVASDDASVSTAEASVAIADGLMPSEDASNAVEDAALPDVTQPPPLCRFGWCWRHPLPQGNTLNDVFGSAPNDVWAVGEVGTAIHFDGSEWSL